MESFSYMSQESLEAVCEENDRLTGQTGGHLVHYRMELNPSDFRNLIAALGWFYHHGPEVVDPDVQGEDDLIEWTGDFVSAIAQTFGIEMI